MAASAVQLGQIEPLTTPHGRIDLTCNSIQFPFIWNRRACRSTCVRYRANAGRTLNLFRVEHARPEGVLLPHLRVDEVLLHESLHRPVLSTPGGTTTTDVRIKYMEEKQER